MSDPYIAFIFGVGGLVAIGFAFAQFGLPIIERRSQRQHTLRHLPAE